MGNRARLTTVFLLAALAASASVLQGKIVLPGLGPVVNGTLALALSQAGVVPGSYAVAAASAACYTSVDGSVVGAPNPLLAPTGGPVASGGTLPAGTYYVELAYTGTGAQATLVSPEVVWVLSAAGHLLVSPPALSPADATNYAVYVGTASGAETLQGSAALGQQYLQTVPLTAGTAPPATNNFTCTIAGNDTLMPAYTYYTATLSDVNGNVLAGYPQNWYISGSTLDVSQILPLSTNPSVRFPTPILATPSSPTAQSLASALNLNGYAITHVQNLGPGSASFFWSGPLPAPVATLGAWTVSSAVTALRVSGSAQTAGTGTGGDTLQVFDITSGGTCTFTVPASAYFFGSTTASTGTGTGSCSFSAGDALLLRLSATSRSGGVEPQNVSFVIELASQ